MKIFNLLAMGSIMTFIFNCGLFEKRFPPQGTFCNVLEKPPTCIFVDFKNRIIQFNEEEVYPMESLNRVTYSFYKSPGEKIQVQVMTENRVKLSDGRFYLRKKTKSK